MKKYFYSLFSLFLVFGISEKAFAQVPNPGFEDWTGDSPAGWNITSTAYAEKSTDAHGGSNAVRLFTSSVSGYYVTGAIITGEDGGNGFFACNCRPEAVRFWYKLTSGGGDNLQAIVGAFNSADDNFAGSGSFMVNTSTAVYKEGGVNVTYTKAGNADSVSILFTVNPNPGHEGTSFIVDDVSFGSTFTSINETSADAAAMLEKIQPNPATDFANIIYNVPATMMVTLEVYDVTGRLVQAVVNEKQAPGRYKAVVNVQDMPAGTYFCRLNAGGNIISDKMVVAK